jgi:hypothetical protein
MVENLIRGSESRSAIGVGGRRGLSAGDEGCTEGGG